jgi:DNA-directed RNA polymerase specialized sigma24 family protein
MLGEHDITALLQQVSAGQAGAFEALFGRVYRSRQKRGGGLRHLPLEAALILGDEAADPLVLALDAALSRLEGLAPEAARVVELRFFGGLSQDECADLLGVSRRTVCRHWDYAQAWLFRAMQDAEA